VLTSTWIQDRVAGLWIKEAVVWLLSKNRPEEVDLRSDTVTRPTEAMRAAMHDAPVGDDVFRDDVTVLALEELGAQLLGKEAGLFVPSGTMANQLALRCHTRSGDEVICHAGAHLYNYESGAQSALAGIAIRPIASDDGSLPVETVQSSLHLSDDPHLAPTSLICFENTHNGCGGCVVDPENIAAVSGLARKHGLALHMDGARLFNAAAGSGTSAREMASSFDTVSVCLSKGLGAPVGSLLLGSADHIKIAYRFRKMYGGAMRQAGVIAAAGLHALNHHVERLAEDHRRAKMLAEELNLLPHVHVDLEKIHTNLVYFELGEGHPLVQDGEAGDLLERLGARDILITGGGRRFRAVLHLDVDDAKLEKALGVFREVLGE